MEKYFITGYEFEKLLKFCERYKYKIVIKDGIIIISESSGKRVFNGDMSIYSLRDIREKCIKERIMSCTKDENSPPF